MKLRQQEIGVKNVTKGKCHDINIIKTVDFFMGDKKSESNIEEIPWNWNSLVTKIYGKYYSRS